jgi:hypothetical protein
VSFVQGVPANVIEDFASGVRQAGLDQYEVLSGLAVAGHERAGLDVLVEAATELDVPWKRPRTRLATG